MRSRFVLSALLASVTLALVCTLSACPLDPAKVPPCTGHEVFPDPCAAAPRDGGAG